MNLLLLLVLLPLVGCGLVAIVPRAVVKQTALLIALAGLVVGDILFAGFDSAQGTQLQWVFSVPWLDVYQVRFGLGVDGLSILLVFLTKLMMPIALLSSWSVEKSEKAMFASFLLLDFAMTGTFLATDLILFYIFWEIMLIPMILLIGIWGSGDRIYAALKFFLFTFAGSVLMLASIFYLMASYKMQFGHYTADIATLKAVVFPAAQFLGFTVEQWVFLGFLVAFAVKVPLFPFHTWLPDAHVQAPTGGSILLAAVLLKMGTYGLLRLAIPFCPLGFESFKTVLIIFSVIGIVYGAWVAFQQTDMKKLVAYSSVSHMGFVVLGICVANAAALNGAVLQMVNHGLTTGALFFLVGVLYERRHTREFSAYGGLASVIPWFSFFLVFVSCASMAVPGLNGFVGEFMILLGSFESNPMATIVAVTGVVFGALYMLVFLRNVLFGPVSVEENKHLKDLRLVEWTALIPLAVLMIWTGIRPETFLSKVRPTLNAYWAQSKASK